MIAVILRVCQWIGKKIIAGVHHSRPLIFALSFFTILGFLMHSFYLTFLDPADRPVRTQVVTVEKQAIGYYSDGQTLYEYEDEEPCPQCGRKLILMYIDQNGYVSTNKVDKANTVRCDSCKIDYSFFLPE